MTKLIYIKIFQQTNFFNENAKCQEIVLVFCILIYIYIVCVCVCLLVCVCVLICYLVFIDRTLLLHSIQFFSAPTAFLYII